MIKKYLIIIIITIIILSILIFRCNNYFPPKLILVKQGEVQSVEYVHGNYFELTKTIVHFKDGSTVIMSGRTYSIPNKVAIYVYDKAQYDNFIIKDLSEDMEPILWQSSISGKIMELK